MLAERLAVIAASPSGLRAACCVLPAEGGRRSRQQPIRRVFGGRWAGASLFVALILGSVAAAPQRQAVAPVEFNRDVRPILSENCFACHGRDAGKRMAGLRLDTADALKPLPSGHTAVVPGSLTASALNRRITARDGTVMPPPTSGKNLTPRQIETLRRRTAPGRRH